MRLPDARRPGTIPEVVEWPPAGPCGHLRPSLSIALGLDQDRAGRRSAIEHGPPGASPLHQAGVKQDLEVTAHRSEPLTRQHYVHLALSSILQPEHIGAEHLSGAYGIPRASEPSESNVQHRSGVYTYMRTGAGGTCRNRWRGGVR